MKNRLIFIGIMLTIILLYSCVNKSRKVENIYTFAKVYGYVRWFYPGDENAQIDWNKFAVYGVQKVEKARNEIELKKILLELFTPIAPAIQISNSNKNGSFEIQSIIPKDTSNLIPVAWLHFGVFLGDKHLPYISIRTNRDESKEILPSLIHHPIDISVYHGKEIKLTFSARSTKKSDKGCAYLFAAIERTGNGIYSPEIVPNSKWNRYYFFNYNDLEEKIIKPDTCWEKYSRIINVDKEDNQLTFGIGVDKSLDLLVSDFNIMVREKGIWTPIRLPNGNFSRKFDGWETHEIQYNVSIDSIKSDIGSNSVRLGYSRQVPKIGEFIKKNIGNNLTLIMPLSLYSTKEHTFPISNLSQLISLKEDLDKFSVSTLKNRNVHIANVIIAWNVFQHFYPYFCVNMEWEKELRATLYNLYERESDPKFFESFEEMTAKLQDAHLIISGANYIGYGLKIKTDIFDNNIIVTSSGSDQIKEGDIIKIIDGKNAMDELREKEVLISASSNVKRFRALFLFGSITEQRDANVILIRDNKEIEIIVPRIPGTNQYFSQNINSTDVIDFGDSIFYLKGSNLDVNSYLSCLTNAKGIIIGSTNQLMGLLPHLIKEPTWCIGAQASIPINTYPDGEKTIWVSAGGGNLINPELPFFKSKIAIITYPSDQSHLESNLGIYDYNKLGVRVGDTTAGCNGAVNYIPLLGGYSIRWTGMKFLMPDGSQLHKIGFNPDYPVIRTKEAVLHGRDEYIEKAHEILKTKIK
jgi:hypothetical protein